MKNTLLLLLIMGFIGCEHESREEDINCKYQGAIIYSKFDYLNCYTLKYKGEILEYVHYYAIDGWYQVGDTINKPCIK